MKNLQPFLKKSIPYAISTVILLLFTMVMFYPQIEGKVRTSSDITTFKVKSHENDEFYKETGERSYWNATMFSGMPDQLLQLGRSQNLVGKSLRVLKLFWTGPIGVFFLLGLMCFISLCLLGVNPWLSLVGAMLLSWNSNLLILFSAGHITKVSVITFFPLIICGAILCFQGKYLKGAVPIAFGTSLAIYCDHIQMLYYLIFAMLIMGLVYLIYSVKEKTFSTFYKGALVALAAASLAGLSNFSQLYSSHSFSEETMRGNPILEKKEGVQANSSSEVMGLDWEYAMRWSNDSKDLMAMFIPRFVGGSNGERVSEKSTEGKIMKRLGAKRDKGKNVRVPGYWGALPFTGGPSYFGASLIFLFIFSMFLIDVRLRWSILGAVLLYILMSLGKNAAWLNEFMFNNVPLFNKFRAPNSSLMSIPILFVLPAVLGLHKLINTEDKSKFLKPLYISTGLTGGVALFFYLMGSSLFDFMSPADMQYDAQVQDMFRDIRVGLQKSDSMRSLIFSLLTGGTLWLYISGKLKNYLWVLLGVAVIYLIDITQVNNRYIKSYDYITRTQEKSALKPSQNDQAIFQNETKGKGFYRVYDLSVNTFNDARPSYHHHQIGGYDPAKLQRYQDVIEQYISVGNFEVLNMLNTKYIITQDGRISTNAQANGTAWFVKDMVTANTSREEIDALETFGTDTTAVVLTKEFEGQQISAGNGQGSIELIDFRPNRMVYKSSSSSDQLAIFSEIYYGPNKGWEVTLDGEAVDHFRANYILRGMMVPAGDHEIVFEFIPKPKLGWLTLLSSLLILGMVFGGIGMYLKEEVT